MFTDSLHSLRRRDMLKAAENHIFCRVQICFLACIFSFFVIKYLDVL